MAQGSRLVSGLFLILGCCFLLVGVIGIIGHMVRPVYGGLVLDAVSLGLGAASLYVRRRLRAEAGK